MFNLNKKMILLGILSVVIIVLGACSNSSSTDDKSNNSKANGEDGEIRLTIASGNSGGTYYYIGAGIADILEKKGENFSVTTEATSGSPTENLAFTSSDAYTLGISTLDGVYHGYHGDEEFGFDEELDNLGIVMAGHQLTFYITTMASSGIDEIEKIEGTKVALPPLKSTAYNQAIAVLEEYGLKEDEDYDATFLTYSEMADALTDGTIDVAIIGGGIPAAGVTDLTYTEDVNVLSIDEDIINSVQEQNEYWSVADLPENTYEGQEESIKILNAPAVLVNNTDLPKDVAKEIQEILLDSNEEFTEIHEEGKAWSKESTEEIKGAIDVPFYPDF